MKGKRFGSTSLSGFSKIMKDDTSVFDTGLFEFFSFLFYFFSILFDLPFDFVLGLEGLSL